MKLFVALTSGAMAQFGIDNFGFDLGANLAAPVASGNQLDIPTGDIFADLSAPPSLGGNTLDFANFVPPVAAPAAPAAEAAPAVEEAAPEAAPANLDLADLFSAFEPNRPETNRPGDEGEEERYGIFSTTPAAPTITNVFDLGFDCWKCDRMSFEDCAQFGSFAACPSGDYDVCFLEVRETSNSLQQICTGCKDEMACASLKHENFRSTNPTPFDQCRPTNADQARRGRWGGSKQSVCRQCFNTCDHDSTTSGNNAKNWCPTYEMASTADHLMSSAVVPDQSSFRIPKWDLANHWKLGTGVGHGQHKEDVGFWRVDLVADQMTALNALIIAGTVDKSDFDGDVNYNADGTINMNNSG